MVTCPECDIEIKIDETDLEEMEVGDPWVCDGCASNLRLASIDPLEFESDDEEDDDEEEEAEEKADAAEGDDDVADDEDDDADGDDWDE
ncbi:MAG TPA: hypothetical protein PKW63_16140 [Vicinamibacterales bacterium]|jgi:hypothetical protein|nr:hypothetical protein [Acidobacteriota bacterium]HQX83296.1 hypothetical protein [Vicinamibacterales bacterium]